MAPDFNANDRLQDAPPKQLGQDIPAPLHERLEQLCDIAYHAGERRRPTKAEMVAAVILGSPTDGTTLRKLLSDLGDATVEKALVSTPEKSGNVISLPRRSSGPRKPRGPR